MSDEQTPQGFSIEPDLPNNQIRVVTHGGGGAQFPNASYGGGGAGGVTGWDAPPSNKRLLAMSQEELEFLRADRRSLGLADIRERFGYHKPAGEAVQEMHRVTRQVFMDVADIFDKMLPAGRSKSVFFTQLEEACMWANKAIAEMSPVVDE